MDSSTTALLTFQESPTKDECGNEWVAVGNPTISAEHSKFGSALQLDGSNYIETTNTITLGDDAFTIDFWLYANEEAQGDALGQEAFLVRVTPSFLSSPFSFFPGNDEFEIESRSVNYYIVGAEEVTGYTNNILCGQLTHIAIIYSPFGFYDDYGGEYGTLFCFLNGVLALTLPTYKMANSFARNNVKISVGSGIKGSISEFRISDGIARWIVDSNGNFIKNLKHKSTFGYGGKDGEKGYYLEEYNAESNTYEEINPIGTKWFDPPTHSYTYDPSQQIDPTPLESTLESANADTHRHIIKGFEHAHFNTLRHMFEGTSVGTIRKLHKKEYARADTVVKCPTELNYTALNNTFTNYEIVEFNVTLQERTLSDRFTVISTRNDWEIGNAFKGTLFNYEFSFLIEDIHQERGISTFNGMYDQDKLLYSHIFPEVVYNPLTGEAYGRGSAIDWFNPIDATRHTVKYGGARYFMLDMAKYFGMETDIRIDDFMHTQDFTNTNITYYDLISTLFGWTSRVPRRQINVFIRGNKLFVIQRGKEDSVFDISDIPHSQPRVERSLIRSMFNNPLTKGRNKKESDEDPDPENLEPWMEYEEVAVPFTGVIDFSVGNSYHQLSFISGFLRNESHKNAIAGSSNESNIVYTYETIYPADATELQIFMGRVKGDIYLDTKTENNTAIDYNAAPSTKTVTKITTVYYYKGTKGDGIFLTREYNNVKTEEYELRKGSEGYYYWWLVDKSNSTCETFHVPLGNGWFGTSVYENGAIKGSNISQGAPGNKVTPYTVNEVQKKFNPIIISQIPNNPDDPEDPNYDDETYTEWRNRMSPIANTTFPVKDYGNLKKLTEEIYWMNRKTQERVSITLVTPVVHGVPKLNHVVDFTERVRLDGNEYFLVSNQLTYKPRELLQKLELVRWY